MRFLEPWKTVLRDEPADGGEGGGADDKPTVVDNTAAMAALQAQIDALKADNTSKDAQITEKDQAARYWHDQVKNGKPAPKADTPIETPDPEDDPLEVLSKNGSKGFKALAEKQGLVTREELNAAIEQRARQMTDEAALTLEYPDLKDEKSEFWKATAAHYKALTAAGVPPNVATRQAANNAYLEGVKSGKIVSKAEADERAARAEAAGGDAGRKGGGKKADEQNDDLDAFQIEICNQMADASGMDRKTFATHFKERAKAGVVYSGGNKF